MSERTKKFSEELDSLIEEGDMLSLAMEYECKQQAFKDAYLKHFKDDEKKLKSFLKALPNFKNDYQAWYSKAQAVIKQVMPDRLADFISYFEIPKGRKDITYQNYMIRDYLQGLQVTRGWEKEVVADGVAAIPEFTQQLNMVKAAKKSLESKLMDLTAVLQADLFDSEIDTAGGLAKAGYLRAAGAICGVVIEKHLNHVRENHNLKIAKKNPGISDLSQLLRKADVITLAQERFIQSLADTRNLCSHAKGREPTKEEIAELVEGTGKVLKTVF
ncbi:hypothetical protein [uncultured Ruegeria sp.]|uniref:hypothetical protein n=1 Tax=uncultured Ruegeria sp. TaxID=259304 RepID=UPI00261B0315|nr:hypothetical protein [uncultured Ruegeria sp.]